MNSIIHTKVDLNTGYIRDTQVDLLVDCGVADWCDFRQRKTYNEFIFNGDKERIRVTTFDQLKKLSNHSFAVFIYFDGITVT